jgi:outer membrane protein assembly factor BamE (lipoprotein component of BamABCDE complex)
MKMLSFGKTATLLAAALLFLGTSCSDKRITQANVNEVTEGMARKQVESILGQPTVIDTRDFLATRTATYIYRQGKESVTIVFKDDKVQSKQSTLSE